MIPKRISVGLRLCGMLCALAILCSCVPMAPAEGEAAPTASPGPILATRLDEIDLSGMTYEDKIYLWMELSVELGAYSGEFDWLDDWLTEIGYYGDPAAETAPGDATPDPDAEAGEGGRSGERTPPPRPTPGQLENHLRTYESGMATPPAEGEGLPGGDPAWADPEATGPDAAGEAPAATPESTPTDNASEQSAPVAIGAWGSAPFTIWYGSGTCTLRVTEVLRGAVAEEAARAAGGNNAWDAGGDLILYHVDFRLDAWESDRPLTLSGHYFGYEDALSSGGFKAPFITGMNMLSGDLYAGGETSGWIAFTADKQDLQPVTRFRDGLLHRLY